MKSRFFGVQFENHYGSHVASDRLIRQPNTILKTEDEYG